MENSFYSEYERLILLLHMTLNMHEDRAVLRKFNSTLTRLADNSEREKFDDNISKSTRSGSIEAR